MTIKFQSIKCCVKAAITKHENTVHVYNHNPSTHQYCIPKYNGARWIKYCDYTIVFSFILHYVNCVKKKLSGNVGMWYNDTKSTLLDFYCHTPTNHICVAPCYLIITKYKCHDLLCIFVIIMGWMEFACPNYPTCKFHPCSTILYLELHKWWDTGCKCT